MRVFSAAARRAVQDVIDANYEQLRQIPGFVAAEPGFPIVDGTVLKEPAVIVFVQHKRPPTHILEEERAPRQLGPYRVSVMQADPLRQVMSLPDQSDMADRLTEAVSALTYEPIQGNPIDKVFKVKKRILCHVGPDAGWPVLKPFLEATTATLSVAMYDLNANYIAKTLIDTVRANHLKMTLTWDNGMSAPETVIRRQLKTKLGSALDGWIVQCGANRRFASAYHEKVAVRDSKAFWLSSGNWSTRSQPEIDPIGDPPSARGMYSKGNREWHVILEDEKLAKVFEQYIKHDRDGSEAEADDGDHGAVLDRTNEVQLPDLFVPIEGLLGPAALAAPPEPVAPKALPAQIQEYEVQPVLTPDNYLKHILELFESAQRSIYLQYAYITYSNKPADAKFTKMLEKLAELSYRPGMDVRIIVGSSDAADKIRKLVEAGFKETVFRSQGSIHNKGIVVDGETVLVSSANWSSDGVLRNRDAGLIIRNKEIATYYQNVFLDDWEKRANAHLEEDSPVLVATAGAPTPAGMVRMSWRDYYG